PGQTVQGDAASLHRLAVILLDNAIKYAGTGGAVTLRLAAAGSQAVLTVHNTGTPIPPDRLPHIFERFYRADPSHTGSGTGLGLAIAQSICQAHHATIRAESGQDGTTFRVEIRKEQGEHHGN
ncbi:MAG TPA: two-component sensor histidine kinase, partial [Ruminococcaceae bacterium]|nr:two-component sensor histidine kinase [Oscillospiraceae bacterium]